MFFIMLKNDLKEHKGLNIILFFFILSASLISVIAANLMYMEITGTKRTDKLTNVANMRRNRILLTGWKRLILCQKEN